MDDEKFLLFNNLNGQTLTRSQLSDWASENKIWSLTMERITVLALEAGAVIIDIDKKKYKSVLERVERMKKEVEFTKEELIAACKIHGCDYSKSTLEALAKELDGKVRSSKQLSNCIVRWNIKELIGCEKNTLLENATEILEAPKEKRAYNRKVQNNNMDIQKTEIVTENIEIVSKTEEIKTKEDEIVKQHIIETPSEDTRFWPELDLPKDEWLNDSVNEVPKEKKVLALRSMVGIETKFIYGFSTEGISMNSGATLMGLNKLNITYAQLNNFIEELKVIKELIKDGREI